MNKGWRILKWVTVAILFVVLFGGLVTVLWNWLVPVLFNGPVITFWQALGLLLLAKILLGGFGKGHWGGGGPHWKHRYHQKLSSMSPEERERFKARMREKWCPRDRSGTDAPGGVSNV